MNYLPRTIEPKLVEALGTFPAVVLSGPRQSGKTTLLRHVLKDSHRYVSLDLPSNRAAATNDPASFLDLHEPPVIIDEVQNAPDLLHYVKQRIDTDRQANGRWVLTGSQNLLMMEKVTESLAGRAAILTLLPLSLREIMGEPHRPLVWERDRTPEPISTDAAAPQPSDIWDMLLKGGYPELWSSARKDAVLWHESHILTYLERDVRTLKRIGDLGRFREFMLMLAARHGQLLNMAELARDIGITGPTCKAWLSVLETGHQVMLLRPWHENAGKRIMKSPKVYFTDTGTLCALMGIHTRDHLALGPMAGPVLEGGVVMEIAKALLARGKQPRMWFWRTSAGAEVDLLVEGAWPSPESAPRSGKSRASAPPTILGHVPIEIKATATVRPSHFRGIKTLRAALETTENRSIRPLHPGLVACLDHTNQIPGAIGLGAL